MSTTPNEPVTRRPRCTDCGHSASNHYDRGCIAGYMSYHGTLCGTTINRQVHPWTTCRGEPCHLDCEQANLR